ncbi:type II toxin-antitoxin system RelE/ParE family toxin [Sphingobium sp. AN641]|uniref:type II toxin-antitoxin system RelE/ParE family toxin n=1 Tax=Sphingobium sp. AN641 TaxID=3133443 RepID=UPI0030C4E144
MIWTVEILNEEVAGELSELPADMRAKLEHIVRLITLFGLEKVREPHVKHLEGRLWEMRLIGRDGIARALYLTAKGKRIVIVRAFRKKTQKTPRREIELALKRAEDIE